MKFFVLCTILILAILPQSSGDANAAACARAYAVRPNRPRPTRPRPTVKCPKFSHLPVNFSKPDECRGHEKLTAELLWKSAYPELSCNGDRLGSILLEMLNSDNEIQRRCAIVATTWIWAFIPQHEYFPSYSVFKKLAEACQDTGPSKDCDKLADAFNLCVDAVELAARFTSATSIDNAGCEVDDILPKAKIEGRCGFTCKALWDIKKSNYPEEYGEIIERLLKSRRYLDRFMGAAACAALTDCLQLFYKWFNLETLYKVFKMQTFGRINPLCCPQFKEDIKNTISSIRDIASNAAHMSLHDIGCANDCDPITHKLYSLK